MNVNRKFELETKIVTNVTWEVASIDDIESAERKIFEEKVQQFANYINERMPETIVHGLDKVEILEHGHATN